MAYQPSFSVTGRDCLGDVTDVMWANLPDGGHIFWNKGTTHLLLGEPGTGTLIEPGESFSTPAGNSLLFKVRRLAQ